MTISTTTIKNSFSGDGSVTEFTYTFKISDEDHIQVILRDSDGVETVKTKTTHYTVAGVGNDSGTVTMVTAPATGETLVLRRSTTQTQALDLIENDPMPANNLETAFDKNLSIAQELQEQLDRSFKVSRTNTITSAEFTDSADDRANKTLGFDGSGDLTTVADFNPAGGDSALFKFSTTTTDADPGASYVRLNHATIASATIIYIDDVDYDETNVEAWVQSFDDVTGNATNRGRIRIRKANDLSKWVTFKVNAAVTNASGYTKIPVAYIDGSGTLAADDKIWVSFVSSGEDGSIPGYNYKFDTGTSSSDPGAGELAFNNGTYASVTAIYIDDVDQNSVNTVTDVLSWDNSTSTIKGYLHIVDINDPTTYARFSITGTSTDGSGFNTLVVTHLTSNNTFSAADELSVHFTRVGDKGDTGSTGSTAGTSGLGMTWDNSTADADNGAGKIAWNNATIASATILYVDDADDASADISAFVQSWDNVTNAVAKGYVQVTKEGATSTYAVFKVNGTVTDASGYTKVPVAHVVSAGSFSDGDGVGVQFVQSGSDSAVTLSGSTNNTIATVTGSNALAGEANLTFDGTNLLVAGTGKVYLNDAGGEHISGSGSVLSIAGGSEIDLTATAIDINGTCDISSTFSLGGTTVSATAAELNYSDLATLGTSAASKVLSADANNLTKISGGIYIEEATLTFDATQDWDVRASPVAKVTLTANVEFDVPTNPTTGQFISIVCIQDGGGSNTIAWNAIFEFASDEAPTATTTGDKGDMFTFRYNGAKWLEVGRNLALTLA